MNTRIKLIIKTIIALALICCGRFIPLKEIVAVSSADIQNIRLVLYLLAYIIPGADIFKKLREDLINKRFKEPNLWITLITLALFLFVNEILAVITLLILMYIKEFVLQKNKTIV